jgi:hypothetical protein
MKHRRVISLLLFLVVACHAPLPVSPALAAARRPNSLFIITDDQYRLGLQYLSPAGARIHIKAASSSVEAAVEHTPYRQVPSQDRVPHGGL